MKKISSIICRYIWDIIPENMNAKSLIIQKLQAIYDYLEANFKKPVFYAKFNISIFLTHLDDKQIA